MSMAPWNRLAHWAMAGSLPLTVPLLATSVRPRHHLPGARNAMAITGGNRPRDRRLYDARTLGRECGG
jgi:hypothetical protein